MQTIVLTITLFLLAGMGLIALLGFATRKIHIIKEPSNSKAKPRKPLKTRKFRQRKKK